MGNLNSVNSPKFPATGVVNNVWYATGANTVGQIATLANGVLVTDGSGVPSISTSLPPGIGGTGFSEIVTQTFTTSGTYTPTANMVQCWVRMVGGGGSGGSVAATDPTHIAASGGGGSGEYAENVFDTVTIGASQTITIGAGGTPAAVGNNAGGNGGATSIGSLLTAAGGLGGAGCPPGPSSYSAEGGVGGTGGTGTGVHIQGSDGGNSLLSFVGGFTFVGNGGASLFAGESLGDNAVSATVIPGSPGYLYGGGGSGCCSFQTATGAQGGAGAAGVVIITEYIG